MADHVESLTAASEGAEARREHEPGAPLLRGLWRFCRRKPLGALGGLIVIALVGMALLAPWIAHYAYDETLRGARMKAPGAQFWMGTDNLGRDMWSRVVYGARVSVTVGFGAVLIANALGVAIGITSGYFGGKYSATPSRRQPCRGPPPRIVWGAWIHSSASRRGSRSARPPACVSSCLSCSRALRRDSAISPSRPA
jgi:hypothetical protein